MYYWFPELGKYVIQKPSNISTWHEKLISYWSESSPQGSKERNNLSILVSVIVTALDTDKIVGRIGSWLCRVTEIHFKKKLITQTNIRNFKINSETNVRVDDQQPQHAWISSNSGNMTMMEMFFVQYHIYLPYWFWIEFRFLFQKEAQHSTNMLIGSILPSNHLVLCYSWGLTYNKR